MTLSLLANIRAQAEAVASRATHVHIIPDRLHRWADEFRSRPAVGSDTDDPARIRHGDDEATAMFVLTADAINFGSGYFPHLRKRPNSSGYDTVMGALSDYVDATGALTAPRLRRITVVDCSQIFGQELDGGLQEELMQHFADAINEFGAHLDEHHGGRALALIAAAEGSAGRLSEELITLPHFADVHRYGDLTVPIAKRAQIAAYDLAVAFEGDGPGRFDDVDELTMFADNLVPHVLRTEGVLAYSDQLAAALAEGTEVAPGSAFEVEIRAVALHAVEQLVAAINDRGGSVTAGQLDGELWRQGQSERYRDGLRHRTRTVFY